MNSMSRMRGQEKGPGYTQTETILGESMQRFGRELGEDSTFGESHHLKKLEGRRLDFDYKKKRQAKVTEDELKQALEKFDDSKEVAEQSMFNLLESDVQYHTRSAEILTQLSSKIDERSVPFAHAKETLIDKDHYEFTSTQALGVSVSSSRHKITR
ncbi:hypothetical protein XENOCAPTIV_030081 [Xenoophorus captivus]|uniref:BAR domain-containing protein n=1 Tax=Xenoophorus captivus TaxID=1517983 RepID=A0ABV0S152_9TELE